MAHLKKKNKGGRPAAEGGYTVTQITKMTPDDKRKLAELADKMQMDRSKLVRFMIRTLYNATMKTDE